MIQRLGFESVLKRFGSFLIQIRFIKQLACSPRPEKKKREEREKKEAPRSAQLLGRSAGAVRRSGRVGLGFGPVRPSFPLFFEKRFSFVIFRVFLITFDLKVQMSSNQFLKFCKIKPLVFKPSNKIFRNNLLYNVWIYCTLA